MNEVTVEMGCMLCPRRCGADRKNGQRGVCGMTDKIVIARAAPHMWEEPPISGKKGSGAVFFSGCPLGCVFCQNKAISRGGAGKEVSKTRLGEIFLELQNIGVHNINLVTPTHFSDSIAAVLEKIKPQLKIPVVYNCGGYERVETLRSLEGLVDIYLPDLKYFSPEISSRYSAAPDYFEIASAAIREMFRQTGPVQIGDDGMMKKGVIVRHLVLPGCRRDSAEVLKRLAGLVPIGEIRLSLMSQYTPDFAADCGFPELKRKVTTFEYDYVLKIAEELGYEGYFQLKGSAESIFTPDFDLTGV
jgi:putative pyruvate formate lyase activating enzyme